MSTQPKKRSRNSEYAMDWTIRCSIPDSGNISLLQKRPDKLWGPPSLLSNGYQESFLAGKRAKRKAYQSLSFSAEVKNEKPYSATPPVCLEGVHADSFCTIEQTHECGCR
jgi:hypothetical protein